MRKVVLTMREDHQYQRVKRFVDQNGNFKRLCCQLHCSERTGRRKIAGYKQYGKAFFQHKNHFHKPASAIPESVREEILRIYNADYYDANFTHFHELLHQSHPHIHVSLSFLRCLFKSEDILSPKARRKTVRELKRKQASTAKPDAESPSLQIQTPIEAAHPHPRRERSKYAGEIVFLDASPHLWFADITTSLHAAIDDATGIVPALHFEEQETLQGYYEVTAQILGNYGIPAAFHTDRRTVFEYKKAGVRHTEQDTPTQFTYACQHLGIHVHTNHCAEAQGKVERLFQTLQSRLPVELRRQGVTTIQEANAFVQKVFLPSYNKQFACPIKNTMSVFEPQLTPEDINLRLAVLSPRIVDKGHCISYRKAYYRFLHKTGEQAYLQRGQNVLVIKALDGRLFASCKDSLYALEAVPDHKAVSAEFDAEPKAPRKPRYVPDMRHPWKREAFINYEIDRLEHVYSFDEACYTIDKFQLNL